MNELLFEELRKRFESDQRLLNEENNSKFYQICRENSDWIKKIINNNGWLSDNIVGKQGELYAWLIVQHSPDIMFQKSCLDKLKKLPRTKDRDEHIYYLTDRILIKEGKKQIYGTQFVKL
jgi:hypothetical protein